ncbi:MAG TPA: thiolase family protein [Candidatus Xenobia bacterium]|nr:thiolase family protein [Candidatus Xenobia bacterium]
MAGAAYIVSAVRTPMGKFGGSLRELSAADLGVVVARAALERAGLPAHRVQEVIFGCARQAGGGPNVARQIGVRALGPVVGVPVPALTLNQACASGLQSLVLAAERILMGQADCVLAGGTESMSRVPYFVEGARWGMKMGHQQLTDGMYRDGFLDPLSELVMGETAEILAEEYKISREEQDEFAARSQQRAAQAWQAGRFAEEVVPVEVPDKKGTRLMEQDETFRGDTTAEKLAGLPPVFKKDGTVTAGNSSQITDGAAALVLVSESLLKEEKLQPLGRVEAWVTVGVDPRRMGLGPVPAVQQLLKKTGARQEDFNLLELNEAFAAQVLACDRELHLDPARLNVNGGAIALGHPIGCSGARIVVTLLHEMRRRGSKRGLATLCVSGGLGMAVSFSAA